MLNPNNRNGENPGAAFDPHSGNLLERAVFNYRAVIVVLCALFTLVLGLQATRLVVNANFDRIIPHSHAYIQNYLQNKAELGGLGNALRVVVENTQGDIFDPEYLEALKQVNDTLFLIRGVNRPYVKSLWMPVVRWTEVTEEGFRGGPVMPADYDGSQASIEKLRVNIVRAGIVGTVVANDLKSSAIVAPLLDRYADSGEALDYGALGKELEATVRSLENADGITAGKIRIHIVGFGKLVGDMIAGLAEIMVYFAIAALVAFLMILSYTRCLRSSLVVIACSLVAVLWQLGLIHLLGFELDPYSILVPFLVFAIGVSHGAQKMNGIMQDVGRGIDKYVAARRTFRRLFLAGLTALAADVVGFAVLMVIEIPVIQQLAISASVGVAVLVLTNLLLLPILLSYTGVSSKAAARALREEQRAESVEGIGPLWRWLVGFTGRRRAIVAIAGAGVLFVVAVIVAQHLQIGDLDAGAPELRADSRYNRDNDYIARHYGLSSDQFAVIVKTPPDGCQSYRTIVEVDRLGAALRELPGVQATVSIADIVPRMISSFYEASPKWITISHSQAVVNSAVFRAYDANPEMMNPDCSVMPLTAYLSDHKAATLSEVLGTVERFAAAHNTDDLQFLPAAGSAGIDAVTNIVVRESNRVMLLYVYAAVIVLCFITFRSWRAVVVAVIPLVLTSVMCEALMVLLGIGLKVSSLPVIALGVGIGVDYALYLLSIQLKHQREGLSLAEAYRRALLFTGKVVALVGATLAAGVVTWIWSPIKYQADMGILLTFMFVWNMVGALVLIPALSHFLLRPGSFSSSKSRIAEQV
jgi:predicted RND superfamily exporter protein